MALGRKGRGCDADGVDANDVVLGPMAPMLLRGIESVAGDAPLRRCRDWHRLTLLIGLDDDPLVVVSIDEEFDRERAFQLSVERPRARIVACALDEPELTVMRGGRVSGAGPATVAGLSAVLGWAPAPAP